MSSERRKENKFIVYTDIVGHTKLFARVGAPFRKMRERHDELFMIAVRQYAPAAVVKGTGDGFYAAVDDVDAAMNIALMFRSGLAAENWEAYLPPERRTPENHIRSRVGVHSGLVTMVGPEGRPNDCDGQARTVAERVMSMAVGNQVLLTRPVVDTARATGAVKSNLRVERFGEYKLREIPDTVEIWALGDEEHPPGPKPAQPPEHRVILFAVIADCAAISSALGTRFDAMKDAWDTSFARAASENSKEAFVKRLPDGSLAAFRNAVEAVRAARDFRRLLKNDSRENGNRLEPLLGMDGGLVTFDYASNQAYDVRDQPVNIPAKMAKTGLVAKWQLLMTRAVRDDAWANLPEREEFKWVCIGRKSVPGEPEPLEIWEFQDVQTRSETRTVLWIDARSARQSLSALPDAYGQFEARLGELVIAARAKRAEEPWYLPHETGLAAAFKDPIEAVLFARDLKEEAHTQQWERVVPGLKRAGRDDNLLRLSLHMGGLKTTHEDGVLKDFKGPVIDGLRPVIELARNSQVLMTRELKDAVAAGFQEGEVNWKRVDTEVGGQEIYELRKPTKQRLLVYSGVGAAAVLALVGVLFATRIIGGGGVNFGDREFGQLPTAIGEAVIDLKTRGDENLAGVLSGLTDALKAQDASLAKVGVPQTERNRMLLDSWRKIEAMVRDKWSGLSVTALREEHAPALKTIKTLDDIDTWLAGVDQYVRLPATQDPRRRDEWEATLRPLIEQLQAAGRAETEAGKGLIALRGEVATLATRPFIPKYKEAIEQEAARISSMLGESSELMSAVRNELRAGDQARLETERRVREEMARLSATSKVPPDAMFQALMARASTTPAISAIGDKAASVMTAYADANADKPMDQRAAALDKVRSSIKAIQEDPGSIVIDAMQAEHMPALAQVSDVAGLEAWLAAVDDFRRPAESDPRTIAEWTNASVALRTDGASAGALTADLTGLIDALDGQIAAIRRLPLTKRNLTKIKAESAAISARLAPGGAVRKPIEDAITAKRNERENQLTTTARLTKEIDDLLARSPAGLGDSFVLNDAWRIAQARFQSNKAQSGADLAALKAEIERYGKALTDAGGAFAPAVAVDESRAWTRAVADAVNARRDQAAQALVAKIDQTPPVTTEAFAAEVKSASEAHAAAVARATAALHAWTAVEKALDQGFTLTDSTGGKTVAALAAAARQSTPGSDEALAGAVKPVSDRVATLEAIAGQGAIDTLRSEAIGARRDTPEVVIAVWQRLADPALGGDTWLDTQQDVHSALQGLSLPSERRSQIAAAARAELPRRWSAYFRTLAEPPAISRAMSRREEFGVDEAAYAALPPAAKFNWRLTNLRDAVRGPESEERDAAIRKLVEEFLREDWSALVASEPVKQTLDGLKAVLEGKTPIAGGGPAVDADPASIGPAIVEGGGWKFVGVRGDVFTYEMQAGPGGFKSGQAPRIDFVRLSTIGPSGTPTTSFLSTTEVSLRFVIEVVDRAKAWGRLRGGYTPDPDYMLPFVWSWPGGRESAMSPVDDLDPRTRKRSWIGSARQFPVLNTKSYYPGDVEPGEPSLDMPMQYITPPAAGFIARLVNCRLPSSAEWQAALAMENGGRDTGGWNLRDQTFVRTAEHVRKTALTGLSQPDIRSAQAPTSDRRGYDHNDGVMWFSEVGRDLGGSNRKFHHLVGNVSELVFEKPELFDGMRIGAMDTVVAVLDTPENKPSVMLIGGSALSAWAPGDALFKPQPFSGGALRRLYQNGCSDVGFRLAFSPVVGGGQDLSLAAKFAKVLDAAPAAAPPGR